MSIRKKTVRLFTHHLPLTGIASAILFGLLIPAITNAQTTTNDSDLNDTFGGPNATGRLINQGTINVNRPGAIGMQGGTDTYLSNTSIITVTGPDAIGIEGTDGSVVENITRGTITVNQSNGKGIAVTGTGSVITNDSAIVMNGDNSTGIYANDTGDHFKQTYIYNGSPFTPDAGIRLAGNGSTGIGFTGTNGIVVNWGSIQGNGNTGTGIQVSGDDNNVTNMKDAYITLSGSNSTGIVSTGSGTTVTNAGNILASGDNSTGIASNGNGANISNTGSIVLTGADSRGIFVGGANTTVSNTGFIVAQQGHQLDVGSTGTATVRTWGTAVAPNRWQSDPGLRPFGVAAGGTLNFDQTALILRPGNASDGFRFDTTYPVSGMIDNQGTVTGAIGSLPKSVLPMVDVYLHSTAAPGDPVSWDNQYFSLHVDPDKGPAQQSNRNVIRSSQNRLFLANQILGATLDNASDWHGFIQPYYLDAHASGSAGSDSNSTGVILGGTRRIAENWRIGAHAGIEHSNLSAKNFGLDGDSTSWLVGLHSHVSLPENIFIRAQLTGMMNRSRYDFSMTGDSATDRRNEYGIFANVTGGIDLKATEHHTFTPEIGLAYLWIKNPSMDAHWRYPDNQDLDMHFEEARYHAIFGTAALRYTGSWTSPAGEISPMFAAGLRQTLSSADIVSDMTFLGQRYHATGNEDKTVKTIEAGLKLTRGKTSAAIRYNGNFSNTISDHIVWAEFGLTF